MDEYRQELIQVAAVAIAAIESLELQNQCGPDRPLAPGARELLLRLVGDEMFKQDKKWGAGRRLTPFHWLTILGEEYGEACNAALEGVLFGDS